MENEGQNINLSDEEDNVNLGVDEEENIDFEEEVNHEGQTRDFIFATYNPQVNDTIKPRKGQEFRTLEDVLNFYNAYAKEAGFSVRNYSSKKRKGSDEIIRKEFVCFKQGKFKRFANVNAKKRRGALKAGCEAKLAIIKSTSGSFIVSIFAEGHNHPLSTPRKTHLLRSHREVSAAAKSLTQQLSMVNIPPHQQYSLIQVQSGGIENVGCTQRDLYNHERDKRVEVKGHDGDMLLEYFKLEQAKNPSFVFKIEADEEQKITRCFWADATSRRAYKFYGDVLIFDTTYNTNRYGLIFAPLLGVNNHKQTIIFACAFLNNEFADSFVWLFNQFLEYMPGDAPKMIITDQDPAMKKSISQALPSTFHRLCSWHILMKFSEKIDATTYSLYYKEFADCIWNSENNEEFDMKWTGLIKKGGLNGNKWLNDMYELRSKWIPAYVNHVFSANMSSSQRAESSHSFFKKFVSSSNSLLDFMIQFGRGLVKQHHEELIADNKDLIEKPKVKINHKFLLQMAELYTHEMYYIFEDEMWETLTYSFEFLKEIENEKVYRVQIRSVETSRVREIIYDKHLNFASCSCRKFESFGIPCRHILGYLLKFHDLRKLPERYILKRWTKEAKVGTVMDDVGLLINDDKEYIMKRSQLVKASLDVVDEALMSEKAMKIFNEGLKNIRDKINALGGSGTNASEKNSALGGCATSTSQKNNVLGGCAKVGNASGNYEHIYNEPNQVRAKGCGKRLKGGKEKALMKAKKHKARRCHGCGKVGQAHDKRNCPALMNQSFSCNKYANLFEDNESSSEDGNEIYLDCED